MSFLQSSFERRLVLDSYSCQQIFKFNPFFSIIKYKIFPVKKRRGGVICGRTLEEVDVIDDVTIVHTRQ